MTNPKVNLSFYSNLETNTNTTRIVHCKKSEYDVYIGRPSKWGNPYSSKTGTLAKYRVGSKSEAISNYETYLESNEPLIKELVELNGKILGCWCKPKPCHGDVLVKLIKKYYPDEDNLGS
jgi:hypothetical protein|tara:strand:- start:434 stop:793 length:360 start_codon:yes stop_codon:yes gene_type:complete